MHIINHIYGLNRYFEFKYIYEKREKSKFFRFSDTRPKYSILANNKRIIIYGILCTEVTWHIRGDIRP
jgi:hypothetical protein